MESDNCEFNSRLRAANRQEISTLRAQKKDSIHRHKRLNLSEVETLGGKLSIDEFKQLVQRIKQKSPSVEVLKGIKNNCLSSSFSEIVFKTPGAFDALLRILIGNNAALQLEAAACMTNLVCGSHKASHQIAKTAGPYIVSFINSGSYFLQDQCAWLVGNIAHDCFDCYSLLKTQGVMTALSTCLALSSSNVLRSALFAWNACTKYRVQDLKEFDYVLIIERITNHLKNQSREQEIFIDGTSALANIYCMVAENGASVPFKEVDAILNLMQKSGVDIPVVTIFLLRCLGYATASDEACRFLSAKPEFHLVMQDALRSKARYVRFEALWILANMSGFENRTPFLDTSGVFEIAELATHHDDFLRVLYHLCTLAVGDDAIRQAISSEEFILKFKHQLEYIDGAYNCTMETFLKHLHSL